MIWFGYILRLKKGIVVWCNRWVSLGGRLTSTTSTLEAISVDWHGLAYISIGIVKRLGNIVLSSYRMENKRKIISIGLSGNISQNPKTSIVWG